MPENRGPIDTTTADPEVARRLERLAYVLDSSIRVPGTSWRIGAEGLLGLVPGIGDILGAVLGLYFLYEGVRLGASKGVLAHMLFNIGIDAVIGVVPLVGDVFDFAWKANTRNLRLLETYLRDPRRRTRRSWAMVGGIGLGVGAVVMLLMWVVALLARTIWQLLFG